MIAIWSRVCQQGHRATARAGPLLYTGTTTAWLAPNVLAVPWWRVVLGGRSTAPGHRRSVANGTHSPFTRTFQNCQPFMVRLVQARAAAEGESYSVPSTRSCPSTRKSARYSVSAY